MKKLIVLFLMVLPISSLALEGYEIKARKKTASKREGNTQHLARLETKAVQKDLYYEIEVRRMSPNVPEKVTVEWAVMLERISGELVLAETGKSEVQIPFGKTVKLETGTVMLKKREFKGVRGGGTAEDEIAGYGIRLRDSNGNELAEKYSPKSMKKPILDAIEKRRKQKEKEEKLRKRQREGKALQQKPLPPKMPLRRNRLYPPKINRR